MDRVLYVAMSGAKETALAQATNANNLANLNTSGFLADLNQARAMPLFGPGHPSRVYAMDERHQIDFQRGTMQATGNDLDVAVQGDGFIAVRATDGTEAYTRRGDLRIDSNGMLTNGAGYAIIGDNGPIALPPEAKIEIGGDGSITIKPQGSEADALAVVDRIKLVKPPTSDLIKGEDGLLRSRSNNPVPASAEVGVTKGMLEGSNVSSVNSLVTMIDLARRYEFQVKLMENAQQNDQSATSLLRTF